MKFFNTLLFALLVTTSICAQEFPYFLTVDSEPYEDLTDVTDLTEGQVWDDPIITADIGFDFVIYGDTVSTFYFTGLGADLNTSEDYYGTGTFFSGCYADIIDRGYLDNVNLSSINSKLTGTPGSRVFHLEWKNVGFYVEQSVLNSLDDNINFQMRFYEGSNDIEIHFGPSEISHADIIYEGLEGVTVFFIDSLTNDGYNLTFSTIHYLYGDPTDPLVGLTTDQVTYYYDIEPLDNHPVDGTVYKLTSSQTTSTKNLEDLNAVVSVFPTLVDQTLIVDVASGFDIKTARVQVLNELGQIVLRQKLQDYRESIDLSKFSAGIYFVSIQTESGIATKKIVKR